MKYYTCILCNKHPKPKERRRVNDNIAPILRRCFMIENTTNTYICNKCAHKCYKIRNESAKTPRSPEPFLSKKPRISESSPPSVTLSLQRTSLGHSYCFVCKKPGPKLVVPSHRLRFLAYINTDIFIPSGSRCCAKHIQNDTLIPAATAMMKPVKDQTSINRTGIVELLREAKEIIKEREKSCLDFDNLDSLSEEDYYILMGLTKSNFTDLMSYIGDVRSSKSRSPRTCMALILTKLRTSLSNSLLGTLFSMTKSQVRRAVSSGRGALMTSFVPKHLGFQHVSREEVKTNHTRTLARKLLVNDMMTDPAILVLDGTYIFIQKSANFSFQRRSFSMHKHRPLVKPMMVVTTTGYIVSVLGPYLADTRNNDSGILNHMISTNVEEIKTWVREDDIFVVDRGFRDSADLLRDLGIQMQMPSFLHMDKKQHDTEEANSSRLVTKIRWVVESANGRIKSWKYLDKILPNTQLPFIGDYVRIVCALCNKYRPPLSTGEDDKDIVLAAKMKHLCSVSNILQQRIQTEELDKRSHKWRKVDVDGTAPDFPIYTEEEIRELTLGVYQIKMAKSYTQEHLSDEGAYYILVDDDNDDLLSAKIQSRHTSAKQYQCWIGYCDGSINSWYCKCKSGSRVVGCCAHVASVVWYLSYARHCASAIAGVKDWSVSLTDASKIPEPVDESESENELELCEENLEE